MDFRYIAIEGPIGVGKSSLAERLAARLDATAVLEDKDNPFLADFYSGRPGAALQAQLFYLLNRHRQQLTLQQGDLFAATTVCDYLFDKDKIFAYVNLDDNEIDVGEDLVLVEQVIAQGQDLRLRQSRRQRAVHLSAPVRPAREGHPLAR